MTGRGRLVLAALAVAVGGLLVLLASGRVWARATARTGSATPLHVTGHAVAPSLPALGIALLALAGAVFAAQGLLRRAVAVVVVVVAAAAIGVAVTAPGDVSHALEAEEVGAQGIAVHASANGWWLLAAVGGLVALAGAATAALRGGAWAGLDARYEAPTSAPRPTQDASTAAWTALDRGDDPTER